MGYDKIIVDSRIFSGKAFDYVIKNADRKFHRDDYLKTATDVISCYKACLSVGACIPDENQMNSYNLSACINTIQLGIPNATPTLQTYQQRDFSDIPNSNGHSYKSSLERLNSSSLSSLDLLDATQVILSAKLCNTQLTSFSELAEKIKTISKSSNVNTRLYDKNDTLTELPIVESISDDKMPSYLSITKICIGTAIEEVCADAFRKYDSIETLVIPFNVKTIRFGSFLNCKKLKHIILLERKRDNIPYLNQLLEAKNAFIYCEDCRIKCSDCIVEMPNDVYAVMSDVHQNIVSDIGDAKNDFKRTLTMLSKRGIKHASICGDIGTNGYSGTPKIAELLQFKDILDTEGITISVDFCGGNHDCLYTDEDWNSVFGKNKNYYVVKGDFAYVYMSIYTSSTTSPYDVTWLRNLFENELLEKKIFLFMHYPMTTGSSKSQYAGICTTTLNVAKRTYDGFTSLTLSNEILTLFRQHKNVTVFSGHSHYAFEINDFQAKLNVYSFEDDNVNLVHVPSLAYPRNRDGNANGINRSNPSNLPSQCYIANVYDNVMILKCLDTSRYCPSESGLSYSAYTYVLNY